MSFSIIGQMVMSQELPTLSNTTTVAMDNEAATSDNAITRHLHKARLGLNTITASSVGAAAGAGAGLFAGAADDGRASAMSSNPDGPGGAAGAGASSSAAAYSKRQPFTIKIEGPGDEETKGAEPVLKALLLREVFKSKDKGNAETRLPSEEAQKVSEGVEVTVKHGVCCLPEGFLSEAPVSWGKYIAHLSEIFAVMENGPSLSFAKSRLLALQEKFQLFSLCNSDIEEAWDASGGGGGTLGRSVKVDNAVRLATAVTADVLVESIRRAARHRAGEVVHIDQHGRPITFKELTADELRLDAGAVTAEGLGLHPPARKEPSKRYDVLDPDMNASGEDGVELLSLFLECHGFNNGRFFAELVRPMLERRETNALQATTTTSSPQASLNIAAEYKLSILGRRIDEWPIIARWICEYSFPQMSRAVFNIEIPRIEKKRQDLYDCRTNEDQLKNIFYPMFMATLRPTDPELREVAIALCKVGAICISSDEKVRRVNFHAHEEPPAGKPWKSAVPDDYYFFYYVWANLFNLNALRRKLGLNTFQFRTICSEETPHWDQLAVSYLLADHVEMAGNKLNESWVLQYMYNMSRVGVINSPISSNGVGVSFFDSAFPVLFQRGLMVSLGTGDPLHYHHNPEPLVEEYGTAQSHFDMSTADMAEIARNSVLISCFSNEFKIAALGPTYSMGVDGNDASKSHVNDIRLHFRHECLFQEQQALNLAVSQTGGGGGGGKGGDEKNKKPMINFFRAANVVESSGGGATTVAAGSGGQADGASQRERSTPSGGAGGGSIEQRNPVLAKLRELQRINSIDRRVPLNRIWVEGPPPDTRTVRPMANSLRSAITLRTQYRAAQTVVALPELLEENDAEKEEEEEEGMARAAAAAAAKAAGGEDGAAKAKRVAGQKFSAAAAAVAAKEKMLRSFRFGGGSEDEEAMERAFRLSAGTSGEKKFDPNQFHFGMYYGVVLIHPAGTAPEWPGYIPEFDTFDTDVAAIRQMVVEDSALAEFCQQRLQLLEHRFALHTALNIHKECGDVKERELNNRDFYTSARVDNFLASEACMNARVLYHYFTERARVGQNDVVFERDKKPVTLRQYLTEVGIDEDIDRLTVDELTNLLARHQELRRLFLSPDNYMGGRYFAELTKHTLEQYKEDKFSFAEMRLPIYGRSRSEWDVLASWCDRYGMVSSQTRWVARISRSYRHLKREGHVENFGEFLDHIFIPLWEVSLNPAKYPRLHHFLAYVSGFDCDGNEQKVDMSLDNTKPPHEWDSALNPPFNYYMYYLWSNITTLNAFRRQRGLNVFSFRPQAGESGSLDHLIGAFLVADGISHGVTLMQSPTLQYLWYVTQLPIAMCPLSNTNVVAYLEHPFAKFFGRGLNVSLATNKPLFNHLTVEPLIEEMSLAAKIWLLQNGDLAELARNSVRMSDFGAAWKREKLGPLFDLHSVLGNDVQLSRVSDFRVAYRYETYHAELDYLDEVYAQEDLRGWIMSNFSPTSAASGGGGGYSGSGSPATPHGIGWGSSAHLGGGGAGGSSANLTAAAISSATTGGAGDGRATPHTGPMKRKLSTMSLPAGPGGGASSGLYRTSSRMTTKQLIAQAHTERQPFSRAMETLEMELEVRQARVGGPPLFIPSAVGERAQQQEEEEELGRAAMAARLKQQVGELERELAQRRVEILRLTEDQFSLATDIGNSRRKVAAMTAVPSTKVEANLNTT